MRCFEKRTPTANGRGAFDGSHVLDGAGNSQDGLAGLGSHFRQVPMAGSDWLPECRQPGGCDGTVRFWDWVRLVFGGATAVGLGRARRDGTERSLFTLESLYFHRDNGL
jgi:hypothetical protein